MCIHVLVYYLEIVWVHEGLSEAVAKVVINPILEVLGFLLRQILNRQKATQALWRHIGRQSNKDDQISNQNYKRIRLPVNVILQRVGNEAVMHPHPGFALMFDPVRNHSGQQLVEIFVVAKDYMPAIIPHKSFCTISQMR